jgi:hypothetical protein
MMLSCDFFFKFNNNTSIQKKNQTNPQQITCHLSSLAFKYKHTIYLEINPKEKKIKGFVVILWRGGTWIPSQRGHD